MAFQVANASTPNIVNSSVARTREYLTAAEVEKLIAVARKLNRYGHRDATMILLAYRHGLRASEICDLQWHQVELEAGRLHVRRRSVAPKRSSDPRRRAASLAPAPARAATFPAPICLGAWRADEAHPHMLRHACGYALANAGPRHPSVDGAPQYSAHSPLY